MDGQVAVAEITACIIPTANRFYWQDGDWRTAFRGLLLMAVALTVVLFAAMMAPILDAPG
jgi:hypothetical protein